MTSHRGAPGGRGPLAVLTRSPGMHRFPDLRERRSLVGLLRVAHTIIGMTINEILAQHTEVVNRTSLKGAT